MNVKKSKHTSTKTKTPIFVLVALCVCATIFLTGISYARYVLISQKEEIVEPVRFYFESTYLQNSNPTYQVYAPWVDITVKNHDLISTTSENITYTIATDSGTLQTKNSENNFATVPSSLTFTADTAEEHTYRLTAQHGTSATVTATSSAPYFQTISATFVFLNATANSFYEWEDKGYYNILHLYTGADFSGDVTVNYTNAFAPDNTDTRMETWKNTTSGTLTGLKSNSYYSFIFFENTSRNYLSTQIILPNTNIINIPTIGGGE